MAGIRNWMSGSCEVHNFEPNRSSTERAMPIKRAPRLEREASATDHSAATSWTSMGARRRPLPSRRFEPIEVQIDHRRGVERQELGDDEASDDA
jgi:hypothetical protein